MEERRRHQRTGYRDAVMIKLYWVEDHPELSGKAIMGKTLDVSLSGVRFSSPGCIAPGSRLSLCVVMTEPHGFFPMRANVQWSRAIEGEKNWMTGVEFDSSEQEMEGWIRFISDVEQRAQAAQKPLS